jgi:uncharacterized membrane protein YwaF
VASLPQAARIIAATVVVTRAKQFFVIFFLDSVGEHSAVVDAAPH